MAAISSITTMAANVLAPIISMCQAAPTSPGSPGSSPAMKAALNELAAYLQAQATTLQNQANAL